MPTPLSVRYTLYIHDVSYREGCLYYHIWCSENLPKEWAGLLDWELPLQLQFNTQTLGEQDKTLRGVVSTAAAKL